MSLSADFAFTQGSLGDYADCARRFELRFIKRMRYPALEVQEPLQFEKRTRQGARFHKLVQQHLLGVPAEALSASLADDEELARWWANYLARGLTDLPAARYSEITLQTHLAGRRLMATYDLLALEPGGPAVIVDWKTGARLPAQATCAGGCRRSSIVMCWRKRAPTCTPARHSAGADPHGLCLRGAGWRAPELRILGGADARG